MTVIRQMPQFAMLPIIAVTARAMPSDRQKSLAAGASDYVTKPVDTDELLNCMERWLAGSCGAGQPPGGHLFLSFTCRPVWHIFKSCHDIFA
jgi:DNA-binding response OmpR family regulator